MDDISARKREARKSFLAMRDSLCDEYRHEADKILLEKTVSLDAYRHAKTLLAYYPIKKEPNVLPIVIHALAEGKRVAFPVSNKESTTLTFRYIEDISELSLGAYSIFEPSANAPEYLGDSETLCIVPALAFDRTGMRMGYGKGYYDRFLSKFRGASVGLCYSNFLVDSLPVEQTDMKLDMIISEKEEIIINVK